MTGYESKKKAASAKTIDEVNWADHEPKSVTYKEVQDSMNALEKGDLRQQVIAEELGQRKLYTTPPQRPWVGLTRMDLIKCGVLPFGMSYELCQAIEAKLKEKNT